jgi:hypothetical protein
MRKFISIILFVCSALFFGFTNPQNKVLSVHKVGELAINMTANEVYNLVGKENTTLVDLYLEGMYSPALALSDNKRTSASLLIELVCDKVWRINVNDPIYKTKEGIGVGSTFGDLKKKYTVNSIEVGEGNVFAYVEALDMSFCLNYTKEVPANIGVEHIGNEVKILKILIL